MSRETILVCDDDKDTVRLIEFRLVAEEFSVVTAFSGEEVIQKALGTVPDLIILDIVMRPMSGYDAFTILRKMPRTSSIPVIMVSGIRTDDDDVVEGFERGIDDYIMKPFNPSELVARVKGMLSRARRYREVNPLTGLPGNAVIKFNLDEAVQKKEPFAFMYVDLDNFKWYNDKYGFQRGDGVLKTVARLLCDTVEKCGSLTDFVGHVGGDDFVIITVPAECDAIADRILSEFDDLAPTFYPPEDLEHGRTQIRDRRGNLVDCPLMTISVGVTTNEKRTYRNALEVTEAAAEVKCLAKGVSRSAFFKDRRGD
ncbi:MAG: hypothetical protein AUJ92_15715 [Armatimonadetes bacterium CG2_30_59_28]|nr:response regulator [Armatimonadota bacterium]OIO91786.1 MAG: hypothetical protein AUJ92_15715 [Armatimonadetes bacterium CG2_30_59_28]PIU66615.1 MAG: diguanylate cyclase response regulator [Armatimonadetes bacterium CG07_land_8_20_14_0_80_59_28]PIX40078.1 MAG: diguanylate cyclase response regulator [Armatimonadetes bacterium CG_4_8_14_3_um_filter_58_9]